MQKADVSICEHRATITAYCGYNNYFTQKVCQTFFHSNIYTLIWCISITVMRTVNAAML